MASRDTGPKVPGQGQTSTSPLGTDSSAPDLFLSREAALAALEEMRFFLRIMFDHSRFLRNGFDPTEEELFEEANALAQELKQLVRRVETLPSNAATPTIFRLSEESLDVVRRLIAFKRRVHQLLLACAALSILDPGLVDHIRREADFFVGTLRRARGETTPTRELLGIPDGGRPAQTMPRLLIPGAPKEQLFLIGVEEVLFWSRIHMEHAHELALYFRPGVQRLHTLRSQEFERRWQENLEEAREVERAGRGLVRLLRQTQLLGGDFRRFLAGTFDELRTCSIPTGRANFWPLLADHMRRETDYLLDAVEKVREGRLDPRAG